VELEVALEVKPRSKIGQAAELGRRGSRSLSVQSGLTLVEHCPRPSSPQQKVHFSKQLETCVRKYCSTDRIEESEETRSERAIILITVSELTLP
jgi:hypothetical protein